MTSQNKNRQVKEIVKCGKDPSYFIKKYVKIQHPTRGLIKFDTYDFQDVCLTNFVDHRFNVILKSRQLGISTLTACYAVWLAYFYKDKNILVIATKLAVAQNFIKKGFQGLFRIDSTDGQIRTFQWFPSIIITRRIHSEKRFAFEKASSSAEKYFCENDFIPGHPVYYILRI